MSIQDIQSVSVPILKKYGITSAGIFGSVARGEEKKESDIDFLVRYDIPMSFFEYGGMLNALEHATGKKVDVVFEQTVHPLMMKYIQRDLINIL